MRSVSKLFLAGRSIGTPNPLSIIPSLKKGVLSSKITDGRGGVREKPYKRAGFFKDRAIVVKDTAIQALLLIGSLISRVVALALATVAFAFLGIANIVTLGKSDMLRRLFFLSASVLAGEILGIVKDTLFLVGIVVTGVAGLCYPEASHCTIALNQAIDTLIYNKANEILDNNT